MWALPSLNMGFTRGSDPVLRVESVQHTLSLPLAHKTLKPITQHTDSLRLLTMTVLLAGEAVKPSIWAKGSRNQREKEGTESAWVCHMSVPLAPHRAKLSRRSGGQVPLHLVCSFKYSHTLSMCSFSGFDGESIATNDLCTRRTTLQGKLNTLRTFGGERTSKHCAALTL